MKIIVTTYPFSASVGSLKGHDISFNDVKRKYSPQEAMERVRKIQPDVIIAGTERYNAEVLDLVPNLKMISRVGIGIDSVDTDECKRRGIVVANTPDAPTNAVAELVICQMINMARRVQLVDRDMRAGVWNRHVGFDISKETVGIIGCGRIGELVTKFLQNFRNKVIVHDILPDKAERCKWYGASTAGTKEDILKRSKIISLHVPLTKDTYNYISDKEFEMIGKDACLINFSRGGIINEGALYRWLKENPNACAAIDVFEDEPYSGDLLELDNCFLTPHLGSCTKDSRRMMESGAIDAVYAFLNDLTLSNRIV